MLSCTKFIQNLIFLFLFFENCLSLNINFNSINITEISSYLQHFSNEFFLDKTTQLTIIKSVHHKTANYYLNDILTDYSKALNHIKIIVENVTSNYKHSFSYFNVLFIDSYESFLKINPGLTTKTEDFSEYYLIIYYSSNKNFIEEIQEIFDYCWQYYTVNVALLLTSSKETPVLLYTYYPFTQISCKNAQLHIINQDKSVLELKAPELFPNKFENLYNCPLIAALWNVPPYLMLPAPENKSKKIKGIEGYLLTVLANVLQFKIDYFIPPNNEQRGLVKANGTLTGAIKILNDHVADLSLGSFRCTLERSTVLSPSKTFYQTMQVFTVLSLRQSWTSLETIAYPFQFHIWIILLILISFLLISSYILQFYRPNILRFIYGFSSVYSININIIAITLNQTAHCLPQRNFARYILLMWILLMMIMRSIYQGALYEFLKSQHNLAPPDTVAELTKREFKLIVNMATNASISKTQIIRDNLIKVLIMNITDDGGFSLLEANPDKQYVTGTPKDFLIYYVNTHNKYGVFHVLKETIFNQQLCIYFPKHSYLVKTFDHIIQNLRNFGLIDYWANKLIDHRFLEEINNPKIETPITLTQLLGIVKICLYLYLFAIIIFLCEIFWFKLKN